MLDFKQVAIDKLIKGNTYLIKTYIGRKYESRKGIFINSNFLNKYVYFRMKLVVGFSYITYCLDDSSYFYIVNSKKDKIQNAMELRAINILLQRITGDYTFTY